MQATGARWRCSMRSPRSRACSLEWTQPELVAEACLIIEGGRHPVVERFSDAPFVPNDLRLTTDRCMLIITGPNMGGKSTYMRQAALIALLAHIGSYVPADKAIMGPLDRIFTRIGAGGRPRGRSLHIHGRNDRGGQHPPQRHTAQPHSHGRDRPWYEHFRRAVARVGDRTSHREPLEVLHAVRDSLLRAHDTRPRRSRPVRTFTSMRPNTATASCFCMR